MKLSTRGRYGLKAMVSLAEEYGSSPISTASLSSTHDISLAYLEQLMASLKRAKLVTAVRGVQGGYMLSRPPDEINVGEVLKALEGTTAISECVGNDEFDCDIACSCAARPLWIKLQNRINDVLFTTTLKDMADDYVLQKERVKA